MKNSILEVRSLTKKYGGKLVLNQLDWCVNQGEIVALLGRNGAGKTTLLESILQLNNVNSGDITIFNQPWEKLPAEKRQKITFVAQDTRGFDWMSVKTYLGYLGGFYSGWDQAYALALCSRWDLSLKQTISSLSGGQRQVLRIIQAISTRPELMLFDEPVAHLDPNIRHAVLSELSTHCANYKSTIIFSSHIVSDLERMSSRVALLQNGKIRFEHSMTSLKNGIGNIKLSLKNAAHGTEAISISGITTPIMEGKTIYGKVLRPLDRSVFERWKQLGVEVDIHPMSLEDWYLAITQSEQSYA
ncbi:ABC transporter ATP-binding protein [Aestuariibacter salexigens]|uniref:ABC transporter ATP-binding protein n=1 Tax=Aestuariibacter salexigens TaxID=226010 RepID=UPI0003FC392D|nr:ABC transporter ATP-binding protein [Aestuariibacter salexigens]